MFFKEVVHFLWRQGKVPRVREGVVGRDEHTRESERFMFALTR